MGLISWYPWISNKKFRRFEWNWNSQKGVPFSVHSMMFKHFDKDKSGRLEHQEFKSCLRALGYDLPMVEEGQRDPEFENILDIVDPNR